MADTVTGGASVGAPSGPSARRADRPETPGGRALRALGLESDERLQALVDLVQVTCDVEFAALAVFDGTQAHLNVTAGLEPLVCDTSDTLCGHVMDTPAPVWVADVQADGRFAASPFVDGRIMRIGAYFSAPVLDPDGQMVGRVCAFDLEARSLGPVQQRALQTVADDLTQVIELQLRRAADPEPEAQVPEQVLRIAAQIGHDLRTPISALRTSLEMLAEGEDGTDPDRARVLGTATRSARRLTGMVDGLLRLHATTPESHVAPVDLETTARAVLADLAPQVVSTGALVEVGELPIVLGDADQLHCVLLNLVGNALKFTRDGTRPLVVLSSVPLPAGGWRVTVADNGPGIPAEHAEEVFGIFSRLGSATEGHGIGLATVARVVEAHGGRVGAGPSTYGGASVWFELPPRLG